MDWKPGFYRMRNGKYAEVLAVRNENIVGYDGESAEIWDLDGKYLASRGDSALDLINDSFRATA